MRLAGGQIEQEGRPEVCLNGVWGSICGYGWNELDGFMFCEDLGYTEPGTGLPLLCCQKPGTRLFNAPDVDSPDNNQP